MGQNENLAKTINKNTIHNPVHSSITTLLSCPYQFAGLFRSFVHSSGKAKRLHNKIIELEENLTTHDRVYNGRKLINSEEMNFMNLEELTTFADDNYVIGYHKEKERTWRETCEDHEVVEGFGTKSE